MEIVKLSIGIGHFEFDRARAPRPSPPHLGDDVRESMGKFDARSMLGAGHWIADRFAATDDQSWHQDTCGTPFDIHHEVNMREDWIVDLRESGRKDLPKGRAWRGILARENAQQGFALVRRRSFVHDQLRFAVAFMDRSWPGKHCDCSKSIESCAAMVSLFDIEADDRLAVAMRWQSVELTRAPVGAIAVGERTCLDCPVNHAWFPGLGSKVVALGAAEGRSATF